MEWTRSPVMRALALTASLFLVVVHWQDRGAWFWVGVALTLLNLVGIAGARSRAGRPPDGRDEEAEEGVSHRLDELLWLPGVAAALAEGPPVWRQVSYLDDPSGPLEPMAVEELAHYVWVERDHGWAIGLGDEMKPYLDLDLPEEDDPVVSALKAHPAVEDAYHEDREVYRAELRGPLSTEEFAELAARALVSHHLHALRQS